MTIDADSWRRNTWGSPGAQRTATAQGGKKGAAQGAKKGAAQGGKKGTAQGGKKGAAAGGRGRGSTAGANARTGNRQHGATARRSSSSSSRPRGGRSGGRSAERSAGSTRRGHGGQRGKRGGATARKVRRRAVDATWNGPGDIEAGPREDLSRQNGQKEAIRISGHGKKEAGKGMLQLVMWNGWGISNERMTTCSEAKTDASQVYTQRLARGIGSADSSSAGVTSRGSRGSGTANESSLEQRLLTLIKRQE